jgi:DNA adenine methylase
LPAQALSETVAVSPEEEGIQAQSARSFLRWQGSKRAIARQIASLVPNTTTRYVEPFLGSGAVFFALQPRNALLSDALFELVCTFEAVRDNPITVDLAVRALATSADYYAIRARPAPTQSRLDVAARFLYLNAHCFNGLYRTNRKGEFNVPKGSRVPGPPTRATLTAASRVLENTEILCTDALALRGAAQAGDFWYLDPPYPAPRRPAYGEYGYHGFQDSEWTQLLQDFLPYLDSTGAYFALSLPKSKVKGLNNRLTCNGWQCLELMAKYRAGGNKGFSSPQRECIITNVRGLELA